MSTRDIQAHFGELYGMTISPELVSVVTDSVIDEVRAWQSRPLESTYAIVYFDALRVKIRDEGLVRNKAVYLAIGVRCSGHKEILGLSFRLHIFFHQQRFNNQRRSESGEENTMKTDRTTKVLLALIAMALFFERYCSVGTASRGAGSIRNNRDSVESDFQ